MAKDEALFKYVFGKLSNDEREKLMKQYRFSKEAIALEEDKSGLFLTEDERFEIEKENYLEDRKKFG